MLGDYGPLFNARRPWNAAKQEGCKDGSRPPSYRKNAKQQAKIDYCLERCPYPNAPDRCGCCDAYRARRKQAARPPQGGPKPAGTAVPGFYFRLFHLFLAWEDTPEADRLDGLLWELERGPRPLGPTSVFIPEEGGA